MLSGNRQNDPEAEILDYSLVKARTKSLSTAYLLCVTFGIFGLHHFYLRRFGFGFTYLFTGGLFFVGWIIDLFRLPSVVRATNDKIVRANRESISLNNLEKERLLSDAYVMSLPPFGLLGFHHFYLERYGFGCLYFCTLGLFGVGWFLDLFRMSHLVMRANRSNMKAMNDKMENGNAAEMTPNAETTVNNSSNRILGRKRLDDAMVLTYGPFGLLGFHHFYFGDILLGFIYLITLANFGICWIADMFRIRNLVQERNNEIDGKPPTKSVVQAYLLWLPPAGLLGAHQFYLDRPCSALLRSGTLGLFLVGWIYDGFKIPDLVRKYNVKHQLQEYMSEIEIEMSSEVNLRPQVKPFDPEMVNPFLNCCLSN